MITFQVGYLFYNFLLYGSQLRRYVCMLFIGVTNMSYTYLLLCITIFIGWLIGLIGNGHNILTDPGSTKTSVPPCFLAGWLDYCVYFLCHWMQQTICINSQVLNACLEKLVFGQFQLYACRHVMFLLHLFYRFMIIFTNAN